MWRLMNAIAEMKLKHWTKDKIEVPAQCWVWVWVELIRASEQN